MDKSIEWRWIHPEQGFEEVKGLAGKCELVSLGEVYLVDIAFPNVMSNASHSFKVGAVCEIAR